MSTDVTEMGFRYPQLHAGCTGCRACLDMCPDFVFEVYRYDSPVQLEVEP
jgi:2-oxoglutarate ferredoxin oxidoreductase subunit delta